MYPASSQSYIPVRPLLQQAGTSTPCSAGGVDIRTTHHNQRQLQPSIAPLNTGLPLSNRTVGETEPSYTILPVPQSAPADPRLQPSTEAETLAIANLATSLEASADKYLLQQQQMSTVSPTALPPAAREEAFSSIRPEITQPHTSLIHRYPSVPSSYYSHPRNLVMQTPIPVPSHTSRQFRPYFLPPTKKIIQPARYASLAPVPAQQVLPTPGFRPILLATNSPQTGLPLATTPDTNPVLLPTTRPEPTTRPDLSFTRLAILAILNNPDKKATTLEIAHWIEHDYYRGDIRARYRRRNKPYAKSWKGTVRSSVSTTKGFKKISVDDRYGCKWFVSVDNLSGDMAKWLRDNHSALI